MWKTKCLFFWKILKRMQCPKRGLVGIKLETLVQIDECRVQRWIQLARNDASKYYNKNLFCRKQRGSSIDSRVVVGLDTLYFCKIDFEMKKKNILRGVQIFDWPHNKNFIFLCEIKIKAFFQKFYRIQKILRSTKFWYSRTYRYSSFGMPHHISRLLAFDWTLDNA